MSCLLNHQKWVWIYSWQEEHNPSLAQSNIPPTLLLWKGRCCCSHFLWLLAKNQWDCWGHLVLLTFRKRNHKRTYERDPWVQGDEETAPNLEPDPVWARTAFWQPHNTQHLLGSSLALQQQHSQVALKWLKFLWIRIINSSAWSVRVSFIKIDVLTTIWTYLEMVKFICKYLSAPNQIEIFAFPHDWQTAPAIWQGTCLIQNMLT